MPIQDEWICWYLPSTSWMSPSVIGLRSNGSFSAIMKVLSLKISILLVNRYMYTKIIICWTHWCPPFPMFKEVIFYMFVIQSLLPLVRQLNFSRITSIAQLICTRYLAPWWAVSEIYISLVTKCGIGVRF